jgi:hypothetical protein
MNEKQLEQLQALIQAAIDLESKADRLLLPYFMACAIKKTVDAASDCQWAWELPPNGEVPRG